MSVRTLLVIMLEVPDAFLPLKNTLAVVRKDRKFGRLGFTEVAGQLF
jgi:hypothetical protein